MEAYKIVDKETATKYYLERLAGYNYSEMWHTLTQEEKEHLKVIAHEHIRNIKTDDGW